VYKGERIVICGPSGSGKSTLIRCINALEEHQKGRITVDGQDIFEVSLSSLWTKIGFVAGDTPLLDGTIEENVTYGAPDEAPGEVIDRAIYITGLDELVEGLPDGWDTKIREGRRTLSDGQRQRVALARVLVADPPILLLDQALSAVDDATVRTVVERLRELAAEKTVIAATNRRPTLLAADRVYALRDGCALEVGAGALREHRENGSGPGEDSLLSGLMAGAGPGSGRAAGGRRPVRAAPARREDTEDDHEEDDD
jgi:ABC-type multidrug transport system fused ATPase/permease subunit